MAIEPYCFLIVASDRFEVGAVFAQTAGEACEKALARHCNADKPSLVEDGESDWEFKATGRFKKSKRRANDTLEIDVSAGYLESEDEGAKATLWVGYLTCEGNPYREIYFLRARTALAAMNALRDAFDISDVDAEALMNRSDHYEAVVSSAQTLGLFNREAKSMSVVRKAKFIYPREHGDFDFVNWEPRS